MDENDQRPPSRTFEDGFQAGSVEGHAEGVRVGVSMALAELRPVIDRLEALAYGSDAEPVSDRGANVIPIKPP